MGDPAVSVLIPVYNNARYLRECLDSVIGQSLKDLEIIIINDGSTDPEANSLLREYAAKDKRIKLINKENTGYGHSLNIAISEAKGEYLAIIESDDFIHNKMFEILLWAAKCGDLDIVKSDFAWFVDYRKRRLFQKHKAKPENRKYYKVYSDLLDKDFFRMPVFIQPGLYKTDFIKKNNIRFNESPGASFQDNGFFFLLLLYGGKIAFVDAILYFMRKDNEASSVNSRNKTEAIFKEYAFIRKIIDEYEAR